LISLGVFNYLNKDVYEGEWQKDKKHGNGSIEQYYRNNEVF
jgi:hypothetical protein